MNDYIEAECKDKWCPYGRNIISYGVNCVSVNRNTNMDTLEYQKGFTPCLGGGCMMFQTYHKDGKLFGSCKLADGKINSN